MNMIHANWEEDGEPREGFWFVIDHRALPHSPWQEGTVYLLPRGPFVADHREMQWYATTAVDPLARIAVAAEDFPLLGEVRGIDWFEDARRGTVGAPFRGDPLLYPAEAATTGPV
ncbi:MAG TPA: hypothetical protein VFQ39_17940 [Longimicrobium sp.]|nr:hypothetical protein [Longimicrobium sp.]